MPILKLMLRTVWLLSFLWQTAAAKQPPADVVLGRSIQVVIPPGFCRVTGATSREREWREAQEIINSGQNRVITIIAECVQRHMYRNDSNYRIRDHGLYLAYSNGNL